MRGAKRSLGEGDGESMSETSQRNPVGNQSHPARASHPPEASLASSSVMAARSVDSECKSRVMEPRNKATSQEPSSSHQRGPHRLTVWAWWSDPAGVREQGKCTSGFPRNLGAPVDLRSQSPAGTIRPDKSPACGWGLWHPRERNTRVQGAVPPCEGNEACGMDAGSLNPFIVPIESRETDE